MASTLPSSKQRELNCLLLEYFYEKGYKKAIIELQKESRCVFDGQHFKEIVNDGKWEDALAYFSAFTDIQSNSASRKIVYHILKQQFIEALNSEHYVDALNFESEIKRFSDVADDSDVTEMLKTEEYRQTIISEWKDETSSRSALYALIMGMISVHPDFTDILSLPTPKDDDAAAALLQIGI